MNDFALKIDELARVEFAKGAQVLDVLAALVFSATCLTEGIRAGAAGVQGVEEQIAKAREFGETEAHAQVARVLKAAAS